MLSALPDVAIHPCWFGTDFYSSPPLTGFGPVFQRVTALAGSWEEVIAEIECEVDSELSHRRVLPAYNKFNPYLMLDTVRTMSSIP